MVLSRDSLGLRGWLQLPMLPQSLAAVEKLRISCTQVLVFSI